MNPDHHDILRAIAAAIYRATGAVATYLTPDDVRSFAEDSGKTIELTDAECFDILDDVVFRGDFGPIVDAALSVHLDMRAAPRKATKALIKDIELNLAELEDAINSTTGEHA